MEAALDITGDILDLTEKAIELSAKEHGLHGPYGNGAKYVSEKLTLSLVHQANVVAVKKNGDGTMTVYSGSFTVWSGATDKSTKTYYLSHYLSKLAAVRCLDQWLTRVPQTPWTCASLRPLTKPVSGCTCP